MQRALLPNMLVFELMNEYVFLTRHDWLNNTRRSGRGQRGFEHDFLLTAYLYDVYWGMCWDKICGLIRTMHLHRFD